MDRICAKCGKHLRADQGFCEDCGTAWTAQAGAASAPVAAQGPASQQAPLATPPAATSGSNRAMLLSIVAVALLLALGGGGWLLASRRNAPAATLVPPAAKSPAPKSAAVEAAPGAGQAAAPAAPDAITLAAAATDSSAAAAASRPCSLVSQADMEQILGTKIVKITSNETTCQYFTDDSLSAQIESTWTGGKDAMNQAKGYNANPGLFEPVTGIGDEAYMQAAGVLHVLKGDVYVVVNSREYPNEAQTESAIAVKAMEKLK